MQNLDMPFLLTVLFLGFVVLIAFLLILRRYFVNVGARGDPTILKREAETELLVMDGHTAVIGGIFTRNTGRNLDQVPFFGDIPLLGLLFQRRRASDTRGELVIFLTPRIVNRAQALGR